MTLKTLGAGFIRFRVVRFVFELKMNKKLRFKCHRIFLQFDFDIDIFVK